MVHYQFHRGSHEAPDEVLAAALQRRQPEARALLFERYAPHVRRVIARVLGHDSEVNDIVHDTFIAAYAAIGNLSEPRALRGWLTQVAVFTARSHIRARARRRLFALARGEPPEQPVAAADFEAGESMRAMYRVLEQIRTDLRVAFALRFIEGMELAEVARYCGVSLPTVKRRLRRAQHRFSRLARHEPALQRWLKGPADRGSGAMQRVTDQPAAPG